MHESVLLKSICQNFTIKYKSVAWEYFINVVYLIFQVTSMYRKRRLVKITHTTFRWKKKKVSETLASEGRSWTVADKKLYFDTTWSLLFIIMISIIITRENKLILNFTWALPDILLLFPVDFIYSFFKVYFFHIQKFMLLILSQN